MLSTSVAYHGSTYIKIYVHTRPTKTNHGCTAASSKYSLPRDPGPIARWYVSGRGRHDKYSIGARCTAVPAWVASDNNSFLVIIQAFGGLDRWFGGQVEVPFPRFFKTCFLKIWWENLEKLLIEGPFETGSYFPWIACPGDSKFHPNSAGSKKARGKNNIYIYIYICGAVYAHKGRTKKLKRHGLHGLALDQPSIDGIGPIKRSEKKTFEPAKKKCFARKCLFI